ncbi:pancreatic triacylglycerol lipase-like [Bombus vosnesenskii]|uniref:phospholipase A1 n=1 Tax=Bombus vosnesenskii TaxID=207650 RepID=A0A6J3JXU5_9HYME|nr:pancreatic triacylglycerol lipase-like [Bombus vosnesenskii]
MMANLFFYIFFVLLNLLLTDATKNATIFLRLFERDGSHLDAHVLNINELERMANHLRNDKSIAIYIHGYLDNVTTDDVQLVTRAYLEATDDNVLAIDYREIAMVNYVIGASLLKVVGKHFGETLNFFVSSGVNPKKIHLIGHSMGAQVAAFTGRNTNFRLPRITGLDPAGPLFYILNSRLTRNDADFVDVIHTDAGFYGIALYSGHVDFYPNSGHRPQPGCMLFGPLLSVTDLCSHHRSWRFYAESVKNPNAFIGKCEVDCSNSDLIPMGIATPSNTTGKYFLSTNAESPFGRGKRSISLH